MNATKFSVLLVIGVLCAIVTARQVEEVSKETKLGISTPKTTIQGVGAQLSTRGRTFSNSGGSSFARATHGRKGPEADASEGGFTSTGAEIIAKGRKTKVSSKSASVSQGGSKAAANRKAAAASAGGATGSESRVKGSSEKKKGKGKKD
ncbi:hypothetical protein AtNW77_Chr1g0061631 [Arabidopsis thaliana]|uniref:Uncharacterized protein n=2 Tax=Arabidopsis TaxID=3701 RepID=A0A178WHQ5_ARATH|nr:hypothetical protein ISN45_At01g052300 [Arabidopsis thaliana x Arabidopsis arenosa]OAP17065.1 hypothetical protein AXX17_AT1G55250 [Arabidopsis thaliana]